MTSALGPGSVRPRSHGRAPWRTVATTRTSMPFSDRSGENHANQVTSLPPGFVVRLRRQPCPAFPAAALPRRVAADRIRGRMAGAGQVHHGRRAEAERSALCQAHPAGEFALLQPAGPPGRDARPGRAVRRGATALRRRSRLRHHVGARQQFADGAALRAGTAMRAAAPSPASSSTERHAKRQIRRWH